MEKRIMKNWIKLERARHDITQQQLADLAGVSVQTINSIEKYRYYPSTEVALILSLVFKKTVNELFILEEDEIKKVKMIEGEKDGKTPGRKLK